MDDLSRNRLREGRQGAQTLANTTTGRGRIMRLPGTAEAAGRRGPRHESNGPSMAQYDGYGRTTSDSRDRTLAWVSHQGDFNFGDEGQIRHDPDPITRPATLSTRRTRNNFHSCLLACRSGRQRSTRHCSSSQPKTRSATRHPTISQRRRGSKTRVVTITSIKRGMQSTTCQNPTDCQSMKPAARKFDFQRK